MSPETSDTETMSSDVFEGPEKKLDVYFSRGTCEAGFRQFQTAAWSDVLVDAACSILHQESNAEFDAYLLSESSLFVCPERVIVKTCGTITLLLLLPKVCDPTQPCSCRALARSPAMFLHGTRPFEAPVQPCTPSAFTPPRSHPHASPASVAPFGSAQLFLSGEKARTRLLTGG